MKPRVTIVGGGIIGLASALELSQAGFPVTVLDRGAAGMESTWAGAGILSALLPWDYPEAVNALVAAGVARHEAWFARILQASGIDPEFRRSGMLVLPPFDREGASQWRRQHAVPCEETAGADHLPAGASDLPCLWLPDVCQVRNPRVVRALAGTVAAGGVAIREHLEVTGFETEGHRVTAVLTNQGREDAGLVVVCAGAWSRRLLGPLALDAQIAPVRGQMVVFETEPGWLASIAYRDGFYLVPRADGHILAGATLEDAGFDKSTTDEARTMLIAKAAAVHPRFAELPIVRHWAGLRPGSPGNVPVIARHPELENLYLNAGHFRYGVTMAPAAAEVLRRLVTGEPQFLDPSPYAWPAGDD